MPGAGRWREPSPLRGAFAVSLAFVLFYGDDASSERRIATSRAVEGNGAKPPAKRELATGIPLPKKIREA